MSKLSRVLFGGATVLTIAAAGLVVATPANAAAPAGCPAGYSCWWRDSNYATAGSAAALVKFQYYINDFGTWTYAGTQLNAGNSATSVYNNGVSETSWWYDPLHPTSRNAYQFYLNRGTGDSCVYDSAGLVQKKPDNTLTGGFFNSYLSKVG